MIVDTASSATELSPQLSVQLLTVMESYVFGVAVIVGTGSSSLCLVCSAAVSTADPIYSVLLSVRMSLFWYQTIAPQLSAQLLTVMKSNLFGV